MAEAKPVKKNPTTHKMYEVKGEILTRKNKFCPKCGKGFFMARHANRSNCGKCGYSEFNSKK
jgi:small subunit ribosomal protein S27Ae